MFGCLQDCISIFAKVVPDGDIVQGADILLKLLSSVTSYTSKMPIAPL